MKYYTLNELRSAKVGKTSMCLTCDEIFKLFPEYGRDEPVSGETLINRLLDTNSPLAGGLLYAYDRFKGRLCPDSIGETAYYRMLGHLHVTQCDFDTLYDVTHADNCHYVVFGKDIDHCYWARKCYNSHHVLLSENVKNDSYVVRNKRVTPEEFDTALNDLIRSTVPMSLATVNSDYELKQRILNSLEG